jgi:hypothetical protein
MYNEVLAILVGEAWLFRCAELFKYALLVFVVLHLFVVLYEERTLESRFASLTGPNPWSVPRWGFTVRAFRESTGSSN